MPGSQLALRRVVYHEKSLAVSFSEYADGLERFCASSSEQAVGRATGSEAIERAITQKEFGHEGFRQRVGVHFHFGPGGTELCQSVKRDHHRGRAVESGGCPQEQRRGPSCCPHNAGGKVGGK